MTGLEKSCPRGLPLCESWLNLESFPASFPEALLLLRKEGRSRICSVPVKIVLDIMRAFMNVSGKILGNHPGSFPQ